MEQPIVASLDALDAQGAGLRVEFVKLSDRYAHRVLVVSATGDAQTVLQSVECDPPQETSRPLLHGAAPHGRSLRVPPALQDLSVEALRAGRRAAFLVGRSGDCHWSLAIEANIEASLDAAIPRLTFDVACRVTRSSGDAPGPVASSYRVAAEGAESHSVNTRFFVARSAASRCDLTLPAGTFTVEGLTTHSEHGRVDLCQADLCQVDVEADGCGLELIPPVSVVGGRPPTLRWRYQMSWS